MDEGKRDRVIDRVVDLVMEVRAEYLAAGGSALTHWQRIQDRALLATRTSERMPEWVSTLATSLQLGAPSSSRSSAMIRLCEEVDVDDAEALDLIEAELGYVMARARMEADRRREEREAREREEGTHA